MKRVIVFLLPAFLALSECMCQDGTQPNTVRLYVERLPRYVLENEVVRLSLRVKNDLRRSITIWADPVDTYDEIRLRAQDAKGRALERVRFAITEGRSKSIRRLLELRPGTSYRYPESSLWELPLAQFGVRFPAGQTYKLSFAIDIADPAETFEAEAMLDVSAMDEKKVLWKSTEMTRPNAAYKNRLRRYWVMKYDMPDGAWLFRASREEIDGRVVQVHGVKRIIPVNHADTVVVLFDDVAREYPFQAIYPFAVRHLSGTKMPPGVSHARTIHILAGQPRKRGRYVCCTTDDVNILLCWSVRDFAKAKLQRQADGRVILVEEK